MPIYEYLCPVGHVFEKMFLTFKAAELEGNKHPMCPVCKPMFSPSDKVEFSVPFPAHFLGNPEGYHKPSPTKRFSTKKVSSTEGNKSSGG